MYRKLSCTLTAIAKCRRNNHPDWTGASGTQKITDLLVEQWLIPRLWHGNNPPNEGKWIFLQRTSRAANWESLKLENFTKEDGQLLSLAAAVMGESIKKCFWHMLNALPSRYQQMTYPICLRMDDEACGKPTYNPTSVQLSEEVKSPITQLFGIVGNDYRKQQKLCDYVKS